MQSQAVCAPLQVEIGEEVQAETKLHGLVV